MSEYTEESLYQIATERREKHLVRRSELKAKGNIGVDRTLRFMRVSQRKYYALRHKVDVIPEPVDGIIIGLY